MRAISKKQCIFTLALMIIGGLLGAILSSVSVTAESNRAQQTTSSARASVQKWDYRVIWGDPRSVERDVQALGDQGYEVGGFTATADEAGRQSMNVLLRRPKP